MPPTAPKKIISAPIETKTELSKLMNLKPFAEVPKIPLNIGQQKPIATTAIPIMYKYESTLIFFFPIKYSCHFQKDYLHYLSTNIVCKNSAWFIMEVFTNRIL